MIVDSGGFPCAAVDPKAHNAHYVQHRRTQTHACLCVREQKGCEPTTENRVVCVNTRALGARAPLLTHKYGQL